MELEHITKQLEWLDNERRNDKTLIATLEDKLISMSGDNTSLLKEVNDLSSEVTRLSVMISKFDQVDAAIAQMKVDFGRNIDGVEKQRADRERELEQTQRSDFDSLNKQIAEIRNEIDSISELEKNMTLRVEEEYRLSGLIETLESNFRENQRSEEEHRRNQRLIEENQRQEAKRIADLQGEVSALRKRSDEQRSKLDLVDDTMRKLDLRMNESQAAEAERKQSQAAFIDRQNMIQVDRDRIWKEWEIRFGEIIKQAADLDAQMQSMDAMNRSLMRSQKAFDEISQSFDRRVNELTEMQRLVEERFRQEWAAFKADDQKRWTNYSLANEEQRREIDRNFEKHHDRLILIEDIGQETRDMLQQLSGNVFSLMQKVLTLSHEWIEEFERSLGRTIT
jgi:chromosome segregation ATPase